MFFKLPRSFFFWIWIFCFVFFGVLIIFLFANFIYMHSTYCLIGWLHTKGKQYAIAFAFRYVHMYSL